MTNSNGTNNGSKSDSNSTDSSTTNDAPNAPPQTNHIDVIEGAVIQRPTVAYTSDPRGKPMWVEQCDGVVTDSRQTVVDTDRPYTAVVTGKSASEWIASDDFTTVTHER